MWVSLPCTNTRIASLSGFPESLDDCKIFIRVLAELVANKMLDILFLVQSHRQVSLKITKS